MIEYMIRKVERGVAYSNWKVKADSPSEALKKWVDEMDKHRMAVYGIIEVVMLESLTKEDE